MNDSRRSRKELQSKILAINRFDPAHLKKNQERYISERCQELYPLEPYGARFEEIKADVEAKYSLMLENLHTQLETIKAHFSNLMEEAIEDIENTLMFHKTQNLVNLKDLERELLSIKQKDRKKSRVIIGRALNGYFEFVKGFREEFYGLILSRCLMKNIDEVKGYLTEFKSKYLSDLVQAPRKFPSEFFRHFEKEASKNSSIKRKPYGKVVTSSLPLVNYLSEFSKNEEVFNPNVKSHNNSPFIVSISRRLIALVFRKEFHIYLDNMYDQDKRSNIFQKGKRPKLRNESFAEVAAVSLPPQSIDEFVCGSYFRLDSSKEYLFLGAESNVA